MLLKNGKLKLSVFGPHMLTPLCMLSTFPCFYCHLLTFFSKLTVSKNSFRNTVRVSKWFGPRSGPDLGQKSFAKIINRYNLLLARVNTCADEFTLCRYIITPTPHGPAKCEQRF